MKNTASIKDNNRGRQTAHEARSSFASTDWVGRTRGIHDKLASAAGISQCRVRCEVCGREQDVDGSKALSRGWPECHGYTMTLLRPTGSAQTRHD